MKTQTTAETETSNATARAFGELAIERHAHGLDVLRSQIPFEITEANAGNISPRNHTLKNVNPQHDTAQRTFERKDTGRAPSYRNAVRALASRVAEKHVRQARMRCEHLRAELTVEIESVCGEFFATRLARFPVFAQDILARFACSALPSTTLRALHRTARRACDARMALMAGRSKLVEPSFFNLFTDDSAERSAELDAVFVNARIDYLLGLVRARASLSGNAARAAKAHAALLESARAYFLASIRGDLVSLPSAGLVPRSVPVGFNVTRTFRDGEQVDCSGETITEQRGAHLAPTALYKRVSRLASFVGANDIADSLARGMKTHG